MWIEGQPPTDKPLHLTKTSEDQVPLVSCQMIGRKTSPGGSLDLHWSIPRQTSASISLSYSHLLWLPNTHKQVVPQSLVTKHPFGSSRHTCEAWWNLSAHRSGTAQQGCESPPRRPPSIPNFLRILLLGRVINLNHPISHNCTMTGGLGFTPNFPGNWYFYLRCQPTSPCFANTIICRALWWIGFHTKSNTSRSTQKGVWGAHKCFNCNDRQVQSSH